MKMKWRYVFGFGFTFALMAIVIPGIGEMTLASDTSPSESAGIAGEVIETETGIYYTVKKGDTLWDLSRKFSNSPYLWPDLWSGNPQIANPHRIYPGERIQLFRREDVEIHAAQETEKPVETTTMPQPVKESKPDKGYLTYSGIDRVGFIREKPYPASGRIFKVRGNHKMISTGNIVYISPENDQNFTLGQRYTIYRTLGEVKHVESGNSLGIQHYMLGTVEITQTESEYAIGMVVAAYGRIQKNDLLMPYKRRSPKITKISPPPGIMGEIIMAEEQNRLIGDHVTAFIDKGEKDGIKLGQTFSVFYQDSGKIKPLQANKTMLKPVSFGELVVLHTEATTATVYVTDANQEIIPGSRFTSPEL